MGFFDIFKSSKPQPAPPTKLVAPSIIFVRKGMWVSYQGSTGILTEWYKDGRCDVHLVAHDGTTREIIVVPLDQLVQATYEQIPESRRPSPERAAKFGYRL